jgi:hypothetical protein
VHRVAQFVAHVRARVRVDDDAVARRLLPQPAFDLFAAMPVADRRHALDVVARLTHAGYRDDAVLAAALLHDAAKGDRMRLWHRVAGVLLEAIAPNVLRRIADPRTTSWRHPFWLYLHHDRLSAELAAAAGCSPTTVRLIRGAPSGAHEVKLLRALKAADDAS